MLLNSEKAEHSFRGLSVVDEKTFWVAGSQGIVGKTEDAGKSFSWYDIKKYSENECRDIEAFDADNALVMLITQPAVVLKTKNGGKRFKKVYTDSNDKAFFDALSCWSSTNCMGVGDAVEQNEFYLFQLQNNIWDKIPNSFTTEEGEAFFAASGSNLQMLSSTDFIAVSGGKVSRIFYHYQNAKGVQDLEIIQGHESTGANGFYFDVKQQQGIVVGGDFQQKEHSMFNLLIILWNPRTQKFDYQLPNTPPSGYKSGVCQLYKDLWVTVGTSGIDYSQDGGLNWIHFSDDAYHVVQKLNSHTAILAGPEGKIAKLSF